MTGKKKTALSPCIRIEHFADAEDACRAAELRPELHVHMPVRCSVQHVAFGKERRPRLTWRLYGGKSAEWLNLDSSITNALTD